MTGYSSILYRLSGVLPPEQGSPTDSLEHLESALAAYFFGDVLDEVTHSLVWRHFVLPSFLLVLQNHISSDAFKIRFNEYFYQQLEFEMPDQSDRESAVLGLMAVIIDAGSSPGDEMRHQSLSDALYEVFPNLSEFLHTVTPTQSPFKTHVVHLDPLACFMAEIQVCFSDFSSLRYILAS